MNVLSLFSGIGGLELGLERAGMRVVGQVELDPFCRKVLAKHWPEVPRHDDVRTCVGWWLGTDRPAVDLVCGGFPCQGHSVAGRRLGTDDERWGWPWYRAVVEAVRPPWILIENVPNLVRTGLLDVLRDLAHLGFDAWWGCVPAAAVGAPHLRWRLFVIAAHPGRVALRQQPGWERGPDREGPPVVGHDGTAWALAYAGGVGRVGFPLLAEGDDADGTNTGRAKEAGRPTAGSQARRARAVADTEGGRWGAGRPGRLARLEGPGLRRPASECGSDVVGRAVFAGAWAAEPDVGRVAHGVSARVDRLRALGNAVVPQVAEHIGRLIMSAQLTERTEP